MNILGLLVIILLILIIAFVGQGWVHDHVQRGGEAGPMDPSYVKIADEKINSPYLKQYKELDNVDNVLKRQQYPTNQVINNTKPYDESDSYTVDKKSIDYIPEFKASSDLKSLVEAKQPYFLDEALIVTYYGVPHYWDWRYPRQPIPIEFAQDPEKFIKEHPEVYPSYLLI